MGCLLLILALAALTSTGSIPLPYVGVLLLILAFCWPEKSIEITTK